jgi:hypothetical protein
MHRVQAPAFLAHVGISGPAAFVAIGLFFAGAAAGMGAYALAHRRPRDGRSFPVVALGALAAGCLLAATLLPLTLHPTLGLARPSSSARLFILSPAQGSTYHGDRVQIPVMLELRGGTIVPITSLHLVPNEGHVHLYLDGSLVSMTGLTGEVSATPGSHILRAEFVAIDHRPFDPRVEAAVTFQVVP